MSDGCRLCEECCSCNGLIGSDTGGSQFSYCTGRGEEVDKLFCCECVLVAVSFVVVVAEVMKLMNYSVVSVYWLLLMQKQMKPVLLQMKMKPVFMMVMI